MNIPEGGYIKKITYPMKTKSKKYVQLTFNDCMRGKLHKNNDKNDDVKSEGVCDGVDDLMEDVEYEKMVELE